MILAVICLYCAVVSKPVAHLSALGVRLAVLCYCYRVPSSLGWVLPMPVNLVMLPCYHSYNSAWLLDCSRNCIKSNAQPELHSSGVAKSNWPKWIFVWRWMAESVPPPLNEDTPLYPITPIDILLSLKNYLCPSFCLWLSGHGHLHWKCHAPFERIIDIPPSPVVGRISNVPASAWLLRHCWSNRSCWAVREQNKFQSDDRIPEFVSGGVIHAGYMVSHFESWNEAYHDDLQSKIRFRCSPW